MLNPLAKRKQEHDIQICVKKIHDGAQRFRVNLAKMDAAQVGRLQQLLTDKCRAVMHMQLKYLLTSPCCTRQAVRQHLQGTRACMQGLHGKCLQLWEGHRHPHDAPPLAAQAGCACRQPTWADRQRPTPAPF